MNKREVTRTVTGYVLAFLLCASLVCAAVILPLYFGVFTEHGFYSSVEEIELKTKARELIKSDITDLPLGLPDEVIDEIADTDIINTDIDLNLRRFFEEKVLYSDKVFENHCTQVIDSYCKQVGWDNTEDYAEILSSTVGYICGIYENHIRLPLSSMYKTGADLLSKALIIAAVVITVLIPVLVISIRQMFTVRKHTAFKFVYMAFMSAAIAIVIPGIYVKATGLFSRFSIQPYYLRELLGSLFGNAVDAVLLCSLLFALIAAGMLAVYLIKEKQFKALVKSANEI